MAIPVARALPRGLKNNNPGNVVRLADVRWQGQDEDQSGDPRFVVFTSPKWGIRAIARTLITYQDKRRAKDGSRIDTVREIIDRWAPVGENDTDAYVGNVARMLDVGEADTIDVYDWRTMKALVKAIITHENGQQPYDEATIDAGLIAAGLQAPAHKTAAATVTGALTTAGAAATAVIAAGPAIKDAYDQTVTATRPLGELAVWIPAALGVLVAVGVVLVTLRNLRLAKLVKG